MKVNYNQFLAVVYGDIFDWPLTKQELNRWGINDKNIGTGQVGCKDGYYFLPGREKLVGRRLIEEKISARKKIIAEVVASLLFKIPTVEAIFLTGSVAVGSARKEGDIDLVIITRANTLWLTRAVAVVLLKALRSYGNGRDRICPNIFLDTNHLKIKERNLYTAHEILQAKCLFDRGEIEKKWFGENNWTKKYLPNAYARKLRELGVSDGQKFRKSDWSGFLSFPINLIFLLIQYFYMRRKMTNERVGWGYAFFHPDRLAKEVEDKLARRLVKYSG